MLVMLKRLIVVAVIFVGFSAKAQLYEIGILGGGSNYVGDVGRELYIYPSNYYIGGVFKRNIDERFGLRLAYTHSKLKANDKESSNKVRKDRGIVFENIINEVSAGIEFNFWEFNIDDPSRLDTPYLLFEGALFWYNEVAKKDAKGNYKYKNKMGYAIPLGVGYKFRLMRNFVMGFEVRGRYTFTDAIDYNNKEIKELNFGNPNSNDWYFFSGVQLTYWFGRPPCHSPVF